MRIARHSVEETDENPDGQRTSFRLDQLLKSAYPALDADAA